MKMDEDEYRSVNGNSVRGDDYTKFSDEEDDAIDSVDDECEETESESEEEEPKLKFERVENDCTKILGVDSISCVAIHSKFLCVGSHRGFVYVLDPIMGNNVTLTKKKYYEAHTLEVNQLSIDNNGDFFASCSDDGKVNVFSLCDGELITFVQLGKKIRCVAIDPKFSKGGISRRFIIGDENVTLYERDIFYRLKPTILLDNGGLSGTNEGFPIVSDIKWKDRFVAWCWKGEVRIYDMMDRVTISRIQFESLKNELLYFRCNLYWKDPFTIYIGWGNEIQICTVRKQDDPLKIEQGASSFYVQIINMFKTDFCAAGISSFGQYLIVLCLDNPTEENSALTPLITANMDSKVRKCSKSSLEKDNTNGNLVEDVDETDRGECDTKLRRHTEYQVLPQRPKLHILQPDRLSYEIIYTHVLQTRGFQEYKHYDYHLESLTEELLYFIVCPKDVILAKSRDIDDHIQWLVEHGKYEEALVTASQNLRLLQRHSLQELGSTYLEHLLMNKKYEDAGKLCLQILGKDTQEWEKVVLRFSTLGQLRAIAPFIPRNENYKLRPWYYEIVLYDYLKKDCEAFLTLVRDWAPPPTLYNVTTIINAVLDHLIVNDPDNRFLLQALADLYSYENKYGRALGMYLKLQDPHVFVLIQRHGLFKEIKDNIEDLMALRTQDALDLFLKHKDKIRPVLVVQKLQGNRYYLFQYLNSLYRIEGKEMLPEFHSQMVSLYADFGPDKLLQFLKSSDHYGIQDALIICKKRQLYPEMIYLLTRMGNAKEALRLITHELDDINQAIDFCKEHDYHDLWEDLINFSLDKPTYVQVLLCNIGTHVDPQILVQKIEDEMEIPGLRDSLVKIMQDYSLQVSLQDGCKNILVGDCLVLFEKLVKIQRHGVFLEDEHYCGSCQKRVMNSELYKADDIKVFYCKHVFHESCLSTFDAMNCIICNLTEKRIGILDKL